MRFLGRKVYVGVLLVLFGNVAAGPARAATSAALVESLSIASGIPVRTLERWHAWWTAAVPATRWWTELSARFVPGIDATTLPSALLARVEAVGVEARLTAVLGLTRPLSTRTCSHCPMLDAGTHEMV